MKSHEKQLKQYKGHTVVDNKTEALARYLNEISQNETHFDNCSKKIQDIYRLKAGWILEFLETLQTSQKDLMSNDCKPTKAVNPEAALGR